MGCSVSFRAATPGPSQVEKDEGGRDEQRRQCQLCLLFSFLDETENKALSPVPHKASLQQLPALTPGQGKEAEENNLLRKLHPPLIQS
uniref:Uncharacterized protein n=1 Tax=Sphaerodactylus townsendi TaxID=933632 RepID=A0ACB8FEV3_9SAUR